MSVLDPYRPDSISHGGSFNGGLLGMVAGKAAMRELTPERLQRMESTAETLAGVLPEAAARHGVPLSISRFGSCFGVYVSDTPPAAAGARTREGLWQQLHLALLNHGVYLGHEGEMATTTLTDDRIVEETIAGFQEALADVAPLVEGVVALEDVRRSS